MSEQENIRLRKPKIPREELKQELLNFFEQQKGTAFLPKDIHELLPLDVNKRSIIDVLHTMVQEKSIRSYPYLYDNRSSMYGLPG